MDAHLHQPGDNLAEFRDEDLLSLIDAGTSGAYAELHRRYRDQALRVAAESLDPGAARDAVADAFLTLLKTLLHENPTVDAAEVDAPKQGAEFETRLMETLREEITARTASVPQPGAATAPAPAEALNEAVDPALAAAALSALPDNWQRILWLREVERLSPRAVADHLDITPTAVNQLAVRARRGLQDAWIALRASGDAMTSDCRSTADRLGDLASGRMGPARRRAVRSHLEGCAECSAIAAELHEFSVRCRAVLIPGLLVSPTVIERLADTVVAVAADPEPSAIVPAPSPEPTKTHAPAAPSPRAPEQPRPSASAGAGGAAASTAGGGAAAPTEQTAAEPTPTEAAGPASGPAEPLQTAEPVPDDAAEPVPVQVAAASAPAAPVRRKRLPKRAILIPAAAAVALAATLLGFSFSSPDTEEAGYHSEEDAQSAPRDAAPTTPEPSPGDPEEETSTPEDPAPPQTVDTDEDSPSTSSGEHDASDRDRDEETRDDERGPEAPNGESGSRPSPREPGRDDSPGELEETPSIGPGPDDGTGSEAPSTPVEEPSAPTPAPEPPSEPAPEPPSSPSPGGDTGGDGSSQIGTQSSSA
ncbi:DNA-directed RNA polymerase specialized sigma24 family protein [Brevibacterium sanguinis]|uniref:DNA-directed RNA polymerase specialized sigma24 family protein n=2 Tax=Brevibacterium TaxID=1696 RepID=A0A366IQ05_9MICO|nr:MULTISPECIES: zf-HC2 domain-containing protein [Brevibacterium]RBP67178.1 DNA-directed RNA polymerase specialized sigma24 family protein [Brevibacterium sanguinis]RBP73703.1 DNA-directed RNA polymerase specialized sigma24 family protein [Brevibacterium celere]